LARITSGHRLPRGCHGSFPNCVDGSLQRTACRAVSGRACQ
jgi:hypothetical protein